MTSINETTRVMAWLSATLQTLATGGAWPGVAPVGTATPFITYGLQAGTDEAGVAATRIWNNGLWRIFVVGLSDGYANLATVADAMDNALQRQHNVAAGTDATILHCVRVQTITQESINEAGEQWSQLGGLWRIICTAN